MVARFIYATDFHYSTTPPIGRKDDYPRAILDKLSELVEMAIKAKAKILCGGDIYHRKGCGGVSIGEVVDLIRVLKPAAPIYGIIGNHDMVGGAAKSVERLAIGALIEAGILVLVDNPVEIDGVTIQGCSYHSNYEVPESYGAGKAFSQDKPVIWLSHGMLVGDDKGYPYQVTRAEDVGNGGINLLLNGHVHTPWKRQQDGAFYDVDLFGETIINIGSIGRVNRQEIHKPEVVAISVSNGKVSYRVAELKSARDAGDVFAEVDDDASAKMSDDDVSAFAAALQAETGDVGQAELLAAVERACGDDMELRRAVGARLAI